MNGWIKSLLNFEIAVFVVWSGAGFSGSLRDSGRYDVLIQPFLDAAGLPTVRNFEIPGPWWQLGNVPTFALLQHSRGISESIR